MERCEVFSLEPRYWPQLYRLMVEREFPQVPRDYAEALPFFERVRIYGLLDGEGISAGFVFGAPENGVAFFDVVCAPRMNGNWATPAVLRRLYALAFEELGLRAVWVQPHGKDALKAALAAGFTPVSEMDGKVPVLVMTPHGVPGKFKRRGE